MSFYTCNKELLEKCSWNFLGENVYDRLYGSFRSTKRSKCELKYIGIIHLFLFSFTGQRASSGSTVCNLCSLPNVETSSSAIYTYTDPEPDIPLYANRSIDQKYQNHSNGDCFGSKTGDKIDTAWWSISLSGLATIYKVNLLFREQSKFLEC